PKYQCANAYLATNKPELVAEAITLLKQVIELSPEFARGHALLGAAFMRKDDFASAEPELRRALALDGKLASAHIQLGEILLSKGENSEATTELAVAVELGKADWRCYLLLGIIAEEESKTAIALGYFNKSIELRASEPETLYRRGRIYVQIKNYQAAINDLK